jgi:hypothetical protein
VTSQKQISLFTEDQSTSLVVASLANPTQMQESDLAKKMRDTSGLRCLEQLGKFNQVGLWARTFADLLIGTGDWYSTRCKLTWKIKATKSYRFYFQLVPLTHHTEETASGLLPTPTTMDQTNATATMKSTQVKEGSMRSVTLSRALAMGLIPTPLASDCGEKVTGLETQDSLSKRVREITGKPSQLNPLFVEEMMGFPENWTTLPFLNGEKKASKPTEMQ